MRPDLIQFTRHDHAAIAPCDTAQTDSKCSHPQLAGTLVVFQSIMVVAVKGGFSIQGKSQKRQRFVPMPVKFRGLMRDQNISALAGQFLVAIVKNGGVVFETL